MWFVDGTADDRVGLIIKTHHALGDGIANVDLAMALVDLEPDPAPDDPARPWQPRRATSPRDLLTASMADQARRSLSIGRAAADAVRDPRPLIGTRDERRANRPRLCSQASTRTVEPRRRCATALGVGPCAARNRADDQGGARRNDQRRRAGCLLGRAPPVSVRTSRRSPIAASLSQGNGSRVIALR